MTIVLILFLTEDLSDSDDDPKPSLPDVTVPPSAHGHRRSARLQQHLNVHGLLIRADPVHNIDPYDWLLNNVDECDTLLSDPMVCSIIREHLDELPMTGDESPARPSLHMLTLSSECITPEERSTGTY